MNDDTCPDCGAEIDDEFNECDCEPAPKPPELRLKVGDIIVSDTRIIPGAEIEKQIVDIRPTGYGWKYSEWGETTPIGEENYFLSDNSTDPYFEFGWSLKASAPTSSEERSDEALPLVNPSA